MNAGSAVTVDALLADARLLQIDRLDAFLLLGHALGQPRTWLLAHGDWPVPAEEAGAVRALLEQRADDVPLAYLTGRKSFHGLDLQVDPAVLVPRPDTETLVEWALEVLGGPLSGLDVPRVLDLGTGSGAIALAVAQNCRRTEMHATDASGAALEVALSNARQLDLRVNFHTGDWWSAVPGALFDLALSNPPYIAEGDPHLPALRHEPSSALVAGADGLDDLRRIVAGAGAHLAAGAWLLLEHGHDQGAATRGLLASASFTNIETRRDLGGNDRCSGGHWPGA